MTRGAQPRQQRAHLPDQSRVGCVGSRRGAEKPPRGPVTPCGVVHFAAKLRTAKRVSNGRATTHRGFRWSQCTFARLAAKGAQRARLNTSPTLHTRPQASRDAQSRTEGGEATTPPSTSSDSAIHRDAQALHHQTLRDERRAPIVGVSEPSERGACEKWSSVTLASSLHAAAQPHACARVLQASRGSRHSLRVQICWS